MAPDDPGPPAACRRGRGQRQGRDRKMGQCGQLGHQMGRGPSGGERGQRPRWPERHREARGASGRQAAPGGSSGLRGGSLDPRTWARARLRPRRGVLPRSLRCPQRPVCPGLCGRTVGARMGLPAVFPGWVWGSLRMPGELLGGALGVLTGGPRGQHQGSGHGQQQVAPAPRPRPHGWRRLPSASQALWPWPSPSSNVPERGSPGVACGVGPRRAPPATPRPELPLLGSQ